MRHILSIMLVMAVLLAVTAVPAFAQPECERGQLTAGYGFVDKQNWVQFEKHLDKAYDCFDDLPPREGQ